MCWHLDNIDCAPGVTHFLVRLHKQTIAMLFMRADWSIEQKGEMMNLKEWIEDKDVGKYRSSVS